MVKGITRHVIVIKSPDKRLFDEAIFIVREDAYRESGVTGDDIIREAQSVADNYIRHNVKSGLLSRVPAPVYAALGAAVTAAAWLITAFFL